MAKSRAEEKQMMKKKQHVEKKKSFDALSAFLALLIIAISIVGVNCYISQYEKKMCIRDRDPVQFVRCP